MRDDGSARERERLLIVGNGMASVRLLQEIARANPARADITVVGNEPQPAYNRVLLSSLLAGEVADADLVLAPREWYAQAGARLVTGTAAVAVDAAARVVTLADGAHLPFDRLVLATGADPVRLPLPGAGLDGVVTFRTSADVAAMRLVIAAGAPAVVIGGGLLGIEAAHGLAVAGVSVTLVHVMDRLMERQLDAEGARLLADALRAKGITLRLLTQTKAILGKDRVEAVETGSGERIPCGLLVMAVGVRPATQLAASAGLRIGRGIIVDEMLATSVPGIYAIGDCAEHAGLCYGLVEPAYEQARVLAAVLAGREASYAGSMLATNLKVSGVPVFSAGDFEGVGGSAIVVRDEGLGSYRKLVLREGRLAGCVLVGDTQDALWYAELIRTGAPVARFRNELPFGRAYAEAA